MKKTKKKSKRRKKIDWVSIKEKYRVGVLSNYEIAREHGITEGAIRKKAKAEGWERDLTEAVRRRVRKKALLDQVRTPDLKTEEEIIDEAAGATLQVIKESQEDWLEAQRMRDDAARKKVIMNRIDHLRAAELFTKITEKIQTGRFKAHGINGNIGGMLEDSPEVIALTVYKSDAKAA